ncbi:MAG: PAAR domain-containing protein [Bacteroidota bacterium]
MPPAAFLTCMHECPLVDVLVPHVGGPIIGPGAPTVLIGGLPAARVTDMLVCVGPPDTIVEGSPTVLIEGLPAAFLGSMTAHGGTVLMGNPTVEIGV